MTGIQKKVKPKSSNKLVKIRGILLPMDWDENGKVTAIGLASTDEKEYLIQNNKRREKLLESMRKEIEISGLIKEQAGRKTILLKRYRQI
jgi:hypothetical protein